MVQGIKRYKINIVYINIERDCNQYVYHLIGLHFCLCLESWFSCCASMQFHSDCRPDIVQGSAFGLHLRGVAQGVLSVFKTWLIGFFSYFGGRNTSPRLIGSKSIPLSWSFGVWKFFMQSNFCYTSCIICAEIRRVP